jgi:hypothetical protein
MSFGVTLILNISFLPISPPFVHAFYHLSHNLLGLIKEFVAVPSGVAQVFLGIRIPACLKKKFTPMLKEPLSTTKIPNSNPPKDITTPIFSCFDSEEKRPNAKLGAPTRDQRAMSQPRLLGAKSGSRSEKHNFQKLSVMESFGNIFLYNIYFNMF